MLHVVMSVFIIFCVMSVAVSLSLAHISSFSCNDVITKALCQQEFSNYIVKYNVQLSNGEDFQNRLSIFCDNYKAIASRNCFGNDTCYYGLNQFR